MSQPSSMTSQHLPQKYLPVQQQGRQGTWIRSNICEFRKSCMSSIVVVIERDSCATVSKGWEKKRPPYNCYCVTTFNTNPIAKSCYRELWLGWGWLLEERITSKRSFQAGGEVSSLSKNQVWKCRRLTLKATGLNNCIHFKSWHNLPDSSDHSWT